jgi:hypothetical protein
MVAARNESRAACNESRCVLCGVPLKVQSTGRPRRFCSPGHRVRYHRLQKRAGKACSKAVASVPSSLLPLQRSRGERIKVLRELADTLADLRPSGRVAELRRLAEYAESLFPVLDTIEGSAWALDELPDVALELESLSEHRCTLEQLAELDDLADDVEKLARAVRDVRRCNEELDEAIEELEEPDEEG